MSLVIAAILLADLVHATAVPFDALDASSNASSVNISWFTDTITSPVDILATATSVVTVFPSPLETSFLLSISPMTTTLLPAAPALPEVVTITEVLTDIVTTTTTDTPATLTASPLASTVADATTMVPTPSASTSVQQAWAAPATMTNLDSFNVTHFADGEQNMQILNSVPANATGFSDIIDLTTNGTLTTATPSWSDGASVMQFLYPAGSVDPDNKPQGGADFYAGPLDISQAQNVTLSYSVFFPVDFDWVQGGKLPGLYGGHTECSGGNDASTCFSTRLMWRPGGAGELYLYAPKDKQTASLCATPPFSLCDSDYGLSIGRGSFNFTPGAWTTVQQTVALNTPGQQDGGFTLLVNGQTILDRSDVFYRDVPAAAASSSSSGGGSSAENSSTGSSDDPTKTGGSSGANASPTAGSGSGDHDGNGSAPSEAGAEDPDDGDGSYDGGNEDGGGLLGLGIGPLGLLGDVLARVNVWPGGMYLSTGDVGATVMNPIVPSASDPTTDTLATSTEDEGQNTAASTTQASAAPSLSTAPTQTVTSTITSTSTITTAASSLLPATTAAAFLTATPDAVEQIPSPKPIGFSGLFFSTFFGGHDQNWATPRDQYTWFTGFSMTVNN